MARRKVTGHLSTPSPEILEAIDERWLPPGARVLDLGCGLAADIGYLASRGYRVTGVDLSTEAITQARSRYPDIELLVGDVRRLPFADGSYDYLLDRGCFHYLDPSDRTAYVTEAWRVLRPGGELLLRACLNAQGVRNDITAATIHDVFGGWEVLRTETRSIPTDTRALEALVVRLRRGRPRRR